MGGTPRLALFDDTHGQPNWSQTGFPSRELTTNLAGLAEVLAGLGFDCVATRPRLLGDILPRTRLLVLPPPTGYFDPAEECWRPLATSRITPTEVEGILRFIAHGGRFLAFAYRFGDSFTGANLQDLCGPLGCRLNDDAVMDASRLREEHPLQLHFESRHELMPAPWSRVGVVRTCWRPVATFTTHPGGAAHPLVLSPGGTCISFDRMQRRIRFQSLPIAVAGEYGHGRFALFGGPHIFETGPFGLLETADNRQFLRNLLGWLLGPDTGGPPRTSTGGPVGSRATLANSDDAFESICQVQAVGVGEHLVAFVEQLLQETGVLKALARPSWMP